MPTFEEIQKQLDDLGHRNTFGTKKEIKHLPEILEDNESIVAIISGYWKRSMTDAGACVMVCTPKRLILLDKGMLGGLDQKEILLKDISSIEQKNGILMGKLSISTNSAKVEIDNLVKPEAKAFLEALNKVRDGKAEVADKQPKDKIAELERLGALKEKGLLTEEEFEKEKKDLLGNK